MSPCYALADVDSHRSALLVISAYDRGGMIHRFVNTTDAIATIELNPANGPTAKASLELNLDQVDAADEDAFNRALWSLIKGLQPYPGTKRTSSLEIIRGY
jgi:hypothetical protein